MPAERSISLRGRPVGILPANLSRCAAAGALGLLSAFALIIVARRAAGALENTLPPALLAVIGLSVAAAAVAIRLGWPSSPSAERGPMDWAVMVLTSLAVLALARAFACQPRLRAACLCFAHRY